MEKVIAVVVTYNRQALLCECINALRSQTRKPDTILVVNNGSSDSTEQWLQSQKDLVSITQKNVGSGGGFNTGISAAFKMGGTWVWCMDDDGYPKEDALELLLGASDEDLLLRNCAVIDKEDKKTFVWKTQQYNTLDEVDCKIIHGIGHPFNGTLLHRKVIERVGVPDGKFFLWGDETEYFYRITKKNKIPVCTVAESIHYHPRTAFSYKNDWDYATGWKMYYYIRNRYHIQTAKFNSKILASINYACFLMAFAGIIMIYQKTDKIRKLNFIMWPAADALTRNFKADLPFVLSRLKEPKQSAVSKINTYFKSIWFALSGGLASSRRTAANA
ncbi:MAG: glycosyltransferase family 2 protein [Ferruginibacter sp.]